MTTMVKEETEIKYAKWPKLVKMKEELDNAAELGKTPKQIETLQYVFDTEINKVIDSFYAEYSNMLEKLASDKMARNWFKPRRKSDALETAFVIISEVEKLREVIKNMKTCKSCNNKYVFVCWCNN